MIDPAWALAFATRWADRWNTRDLDGLLACYADDAVVRSPAAARLIPDSNGLLLGKQALREFWTIGLQLIPDLRFDVLTVLTGCETVVINQRNHVGRLGAEVFLFDNGLIVHAIGASAEPSQVQLR